MTVEITNEGSARTYKVEGRLDSTTAPDLKVKTLDLTGVNSIVFDLEKTEYMSSAGMRVMLECLRAMNKIGGKLSVRNANDAVLELLDMTGFSDILNIEGREEF